MSLRNNDAMKFAQSLKAKGHTCVYYMESSQFKLDGVVKMFAQEKNFNLYFMP